MHRGGLATLTLLLAGACVSTEWKLTGAARPGRPTDCPIAFFEGEPPYPIETVAAAQVNCNSWLQRSTCIEDLRKEACKAGADTVYGFSEKRSGEWTMIWVTMAVRAPGVPTGVQ